MNWDFSWEKWSNRCAKAARYRNDVLHCIWLCSIPMNYENSICKTAIQTDFNFQTDDIGCLCENVVKCKSHFIYNIDLSREIQAQASTILRSIERYNLLAFENNQNELRFCSLWCSDSNNNLHSINSVTEIIVTYFKNSTAVYLSSCFFFSVKWETLKKNG